MGVHARSPDDHVAAAHHHVVGEAGEALRAVQRQVRSLDAGGQLRLLLRLGHRAAQHQPRLLDVHVLGIEPHEDTVAGQRLGPVAQHRVVLPVAGEDQRLRLGVEHPVRAVGRPDAALHVDVPVHREPLQLLA